MAALEPSISERIRHDFLTLDLSVDELLVHPDDAKAFAQRVVAATSRQTVLDVPSVLRELIRLRKTGEDRGGLPRRKRSYRGRKPHPR